MKKIIPKWPIPDFDEDLQPHFLFIITPPFSGSTALAELLNTSHRTMFLQERGEGQWLVPGLCEKDRWNKNKKVNYKSVKAVWLSQYQSVYKLVRNVDIVIEKSPPNMVRIENLASQFQNYSFIANNRNPYANCASILYRNYDADNLEPEQRINILKDLGNGWIMRSQIIKELVLKFSMPLITYETFSKKPVSIVNKLKLPTDALKTINPDAKIKIKDYKVREITNMNEQQIANLSNPEIDLLRTMFKNKTELLSFFGYKDSTI